MEQSCNEAVKSILSCVEKYKSLIVEVEQTIWKNPEIGYKEWKTSRYLADIFQSLGYKERFSQYPHELSGGMRQRVMIAIALVCKPSVLIADEPTTALDVTIQAQILSLITKLKEETGASIILITHDLAVVSETCDRVIVMYLGQIVEEADAREIFSNPKHPYTKGLMQSIPQMTEQKPERLYAIRGTVPLLNQIGQGCRFADRCEYACEQCRKEMPQLQELENGHTVRCFLAQGVET